jgi:hypothetical protein
MVVRQCARRYRARKRNGARCLRIEISNAEQTLDAFVKIGVLAEERRNDDRATEAAISVLCKRDIAPSKPNDRRIEITIDDPAQGGGKEGATPCFEAGGVASGEVCLAVLFSGGTRSLIPGAVGKHHPRASHVTLAVISSTNAWTIWARSLIQLAGGVPGRGNSRRSFDPLS